MTQYREEGAELPAVAGIQASFAPFLVLEEDHTPVLVRMPRRLVSGDSLAHVTLLPSVASVRPYRLEPDRDLYGVADHLGARDLFVPADTEVPPIHRARRLEGDP